MEMLFNVFFGLAVLLGATSIVVCICTRRVDAAALIAVTGAIIMITLNMVLRMGFMVL